MQTYTNTTQQVNAGDLILGTYTHATTAQRGGTITLRELAEAIKNGQWAGPVTELRGIPDEDEQKAFKKNNLPAITVSGFFPSRRVEVAEHTQHAIICLDLDMDKNPHMTAPDMRALVMDEYQNNPDVLLAFTSCRGEGMAVVYRYTPDATLSKATHVDAFAVLQKRWGANGITLDNACTDVSRLRFVSYDPDVDTSRLDATMVDVLKQPMRVDPPRVDQPRRERTPRQKTIQTHHDPIQNPIQIPRDPIQKPIQPAPRRTVSVDPILMDDVATIVDHVTQYWIDLPQQYAGITGGDEYTHWVRMGMACADLGPSGFDVFDALSQPSPKYTPEAVRAKWDDLIKNTRNVRAATLFYMCKACGVPTRSPFRVEAVNQIAKRILSVGKNGGPKDVPTAIDNARHVMKVLTPDALDEDLDKIPEWGAYLDANRDKLKEHVSGDKFTMEVLERFIGDMPIERNTVTGKFDLRGKVMDDASMAELVIKCKRVFGVKTVGRDLVELVLTSPQTPRYNPFARFLEVATATHTSCGHVDALIDALRFDTDEQPEGYDTFCRTMIRKWMMSVVASMRGDFSVLCLVLVGKQNVGKTTFLRDLLPRDLVTYYAESKLDEDKDAEILLCRKLIICDDEFSGKSKRDARRLKDMISKRTITVRVPYGRESEDLQRRAVLCGTSNTRDILNDPTGNRRVLPIGITHLDFAKYRAVDRMALFSELSREYDANPDAFKLTQQDINELMRFTEGKYDAPSIERDRILYMFADPSMDTRYVMEDCEYVTTSWIKEQMEAGNRHAVQLGKINEVMEAMGFKYRKAPRASQRFKIARGTRAWEVVLTDDFTPMLP